jgi:hypothetical protein
MKRLSTTIPLLRLAELLPSAFFDGRAEFSGMVEVRERRPADACERRVRLEPRRPPSKETAIVAPLRLPQRSLTLVQRMR